MDSLYREAVQKKVEKKFRGKEALQAKQKPSKPVSAEREYIRLAKEVDEAVLDAFKDALPKIKKICDRRYEDAHRFDSQADDLAEIQKVFQNALKKVQSVSFNKTLLKRLEQLANLNRKLTVAQWKRTVKSTIGIDIFTDYYNGGNYQRLVDEWITENVNLIKSVPFDSLDEMQKIVMNGWNNSRSTKAILKDIQEKFGVSKSKAKFLAIDQTAKLNAKISQFQQQDAGCEEYVWSASGDARVRERHRELDGKVFRWDKPPVVDEKTGRRAHPGEDYHCRCVAIPRFKIESLNVPVEPKDWDKIDKRAEEIRNMSWKEVKALTEQRKKGGR